MSIFDQLKDLFSLEERPTTPTIRQEEIIRYRMQAMRTDPDNQQNKISDLDTKELLNKGFEAMQNDNFKIANNIDENNCDLPDDIEQKM